MREPKTPQTFARERSPSLSCLALPCCLLLFALAFAAACASTREEARPGDAAAHRLPYRLAPQSFAGRPPATSAEVEAKVEAEATSARARPGTQAGAEDLDEGASERALDLFTARQSSMRLRAEQSSMISGETLLAWSELFGAVDRALRLPAPRIAPLALVRMRVVLESELELDRAHYGTLPPWLPIAVRARVQGLDQKLAERRAAAAAAAGTGTASPREVAARRAPWRWPLDPPFITSLFGRRRDPFTGEARFHRGVDLRARTRQRVEAIADGTVTRAAANGGYGLSVEILHDGGFTSSYSHLSLLLVRKNDRVAAGDPIGLTGNTGRSTASHLHFELWRGERPVDPLDYLETPGHLRAEGAAAQR